MVCTCTMNTNGRHEGCMACLMLSCDACYSDSGRVSSPSAIITRLLRQRRLDSDSSNTHESPSSPRQNRLIRLGARQALHLGQCKHTNRCLPIPQMVLLRPPASRIAVRMTLRIDNSRHGYQAVTFETSLQQQTTTHSHNARTFDGDSACIILQLHGSQDDCAMR